MNITLVTGNKGKLAEWQRLFPGDITLQAADIDLDEIQSNDLEAIIVDKAKRAFDKLRTPVIVEDISAGLDKLAGMPGPFIKYFELKLGMDALYTIGGSVETGASVTCTVAYYDGAKTIIGHGEVHGTAVAPRGSNGFGFDVVFQPDGSSKTYAEMGHQEKDSLSHRSIAIQDLVSKLKQEL